MSKNSNKNKICYVKSCRRKFKRADKKTSFRLQCFPKDKNVQKRWIEAIKSYEGNSSGLRENESEEDYSRHYVCNTHFQEGDYLVSVNGARRLKELAVPNVFMDKVVDGVKKSDDSDNIASENSVEFECNQEGVRIRMLEENMDNTKFKFYTSFSKDLFLVLFNQINIHSTQFDKYLDTKNQLVLTLIKYTNLMGFSDMSRLYGSTALSGKVVFEIFTFWTLKMYEHFKSIDLWGMRAKNGYGKGPTCVATITMDCVEIAVRSDNNLPERTCKYLVAADRSGLTIYCSDVYAGTKSFRDIFVDTEILDKFNQFDVLFVPKRLQKQIEKIISVRNEVIEHATNKTKLARLQNQNKHMGILDKGIISPELSPMINEIVYNTHNFHNFKNHFDFED